MSFIRFTLARLLLGSLLAGLILLGQGCAGSSGKTSFMESQENVSYGANELRVRLYDFAAIFSGSVEQTADDIVRATDDPVIRRRAIQWKSSATAEVYKAAFGWDPLGSYSDVFAFSKQMLQFFESGHGQDIFQDFQPEVVATARILERRAHALGQMGTISGDITPLETGLDPWVKDHPLLDLNFTRESTVPFWAEYITSMGGGMAVVGRMEDSLQDMVARLDILAENLRKQAIWETELLMDEALTTGELGQFFARIDTMDVNLDRMRLIIDDIEPILNRQVQALMITGGELTERERKLAMEFWRVERDFLLAHMETVEADVFDRLAVERELIMKEIEAAAGLAVDNSMVGMKSLIDHLVLRLAQLAAGILLMAGILALIIRRMAPRSQGRS
jgi:hypothetical protein